MERRGGEGEDLRSSNQQRQFLIREHDPQPLNHSTFVIIIIVVVCDVIVHVMSIIISRK